jgi:hypothetical protein
VLISFWGEGRLRTLFTESGNPHNLTFIFHDNLASHKSTAAVKEEPLERPQLIRSSVSEEQLFTVNLKSS